MRRRWPSESAAVGTPFAPRRPSGAPAIRGVARQAGGPRDAATMDAAGPTTGAGETAMVAGPTPRPGDKPRKRPILNKRPKPSHFAGTASGNPSISTPRSGGATAPFKEPTGRTTLPRHYPYRAAQKATGGIAGTPIAPADIPALSSSAIGFGGTVPAQTLKWARNTACRTP